MRNLNKKKLKKNLLDFFYIPSKDYFIQFEQIVLYISFLVSIIVLVVLYNGGVISNLESPYNLIVILLSLPIFKFTLLDILMGRRKEYELKRYFLMAAGIGVLTFFSLVFFYVSITFVLTGLIIDLIAHIEKGK